MVEAGTDLEQLAEFAGRGDQERALGAGQEGELGAAADEAAGALRGGGDAARGLEVDAEGLFGEEVLAGLEDVEVDGFVQIVRHGDVDDIDVG